MSLRRPEQCMCRGLPSGTDLKLCLPGDPKKFADSSPVHYDEYPLQHHLLRAPVIMTQSALSLEGLNECAEQDYCIDSMSSVSKES